MSRVKVSIENVYYDGYEETRVVELAAPSAKHPLPADDDEWADDDSYWEFVVWPETGVGRDGDALYTATIIEADDPSLVGLTHEWGG
jgi:hypothetical protein